MRVHVNAVKCAIAEAVKDARGSDMPEIPALAALRTLKDRQTHLTSSESESQSGSLKQASGSGASSARYHDDRAREVDNDDGTGSGTGAQGGV